MFKKVQILLLVLFLSASCSKQAPPVSKTQVSQIPANSLQRVDLLITNGLLVTMDQNYRVIENGWLAVKDGTILALGTGSAPYLATETINAQGKAVLPGLINTHTHSAMALLRGVDDNSPYAKWLLNVEKFEKHVIPEDVYWGTLLAEAEMIQSGTTSFNDMYFSPEASVNATQKAGMRGIFRLPITQTKEGLKYTEISEMHASSSLINFSLAPNPWSQYSVKELKDISSYAAQNNLLVHMHFEEDSAARASAVAQYGLTPVQVLTTTGLINNNLLLAHGVDLSEAEIKALSQHPGVAVSFNPKSEAKLSSAVTPVMPMLENGLSVAFGTDGAASSNSLDMFSQMNFAAYGFLKCQSTQSFCKNSYTVDPKIIVAMATIKAAQALHLNAKIGSLEFGKRADIITVDLDRAEASPQNDIYSTLVYNTSGANVNDTIIDGKIVMKNRQLVTLNLKEILEKSAAIYKQLLEDSKVKD